MLTLKRQTQLLLLFGLIVSCASKLTVTLRKPDAQASGFQLSVPPRRNVKTVSPCEGWLFQVKCSCGTIRGTFTPLRQSEKPHAFQKENTSHRAKRDISLYTRFPPCYNQIKAAGIPSSRRKTYRRRPPMDTLFEILGDFLPRSSPSSFSRRLPEHCAALRGKRKTGKTGPDRRHRRRTAGSG